MPKTKDIRTRRQAALSPTLKTSLYKSSKPHRRWPWLAALLALISVACGPVDSPTKPNQETAIEIVWRQAYRQHGPVPHIEWIEGDRLNCIPGENGRAVGVIPEAATGWTIDGVCFNGWTPDSPFFTQVQIAWPASTRHLQETAFAHELAHAAMGEKNHDGQVFSSGGWHDQAQQALTEAFPLEAVQ